jgi:hypothetical protein
MRNTRLTNWRRSIFRSTMAWLIALACASGLLFPAFASAGPLDDLKNNITQGLSDAAHKGIDSTRQSVDSALGSSGQTVGRTASSPQSEGSGSSAPVSALGGPAASAPGSSQCITIQRGVTHYDVTNTCPFSIGIVLQHPPGRCMYESRKAGKTGGIPIGLTVRAVCRYGGPIQMYSCQCPAGYELSGATSMPESVPATEKFATDGRGCPTSKKDPRWKDFPKGHHCTM